MANILNQHQAEAIANAMANLNNVGGTLCCRMDGIRIEAWDRVLIEGPADGFTGKCECEDYASQNEFLAAYGL